MISAIEQRLCFELEARKAKGLHRVLRTQSDRLIDFCSNDYLGVVHDRLIDAPEGRSLASGATGSRLISGNSILAEEAEHMLASFYRAPSALLFNSGYDANLGFFSSIPRRGDTIVYDELCHASIRDGIRLSFAKSYSFAHNDLAALRAKLDRIQGQVFIAVESVYSMDGDQAPLVELIEVCRRSGAALVVDEAHASGIFGEGGCGLVGALGLETEVFGRVHTFGKAFGCHGAVVVSSAAVREYLINFARSFIYTTALPPQAIASIMCAHTLKPQLEERRRNLQRNIELFLDNARTEGLDLRLIPSTTQIQSLLVGGNMQAKKLASALVASGFDVRPILSPTVPKGAERLRLCLHSFNSADEIGGLVKAITEVDHA